MNSLLRRFGLLSPRHGLARKRNRRPLQVERLEHRRVLASAATLTPAVTGAVFQDRDGNDQPSSGEGIPLVRIELYLDDGDGALDINDDQLVDTQLTDNSGTYCFDELDPNGGYFVFQPEQVVNGTSISEQQSNRQFPGAPGLLIDSFESAQSAAATPPAPSEQTSTRSFPDENEVIGGERDLMANLDSGIGLVDVTINPFGGRPTLQYNSDVDVTGSGTIVWDGQDGDGSDISMGLNGRDLTLGGTLTGIALRIGARNAGSSTLLRLYQGDSSNFSQASVSIPVTEDGSAGAYQLVPFTSFQGGTVSPSDVDAISLTIDSNESAANNIEVALVGPNGPKIVNFQNVPETDLSVTKTIDQSAPVPGQTVRYTVQVVNNGPSDAFGATIVDIAPAGLNSPSYTSQAIGDATGNTASGTGSIDDEVFMAAGSSIIYSFSGIVSPDFTGNLSNTAVVAVPAGMTDTDPSNNSSTADDDVLPEVDLTITKGNGTSSVVPGQPVVYTLVVTNAGPSSVTGATVEDIFPPELRLVSYRSETTGNVSGNTDGIGDINDSVTMAPGSSITYTVDATVEETASGSVSNTATVMPPDGVIDRNTSNNTSTDTDTVTPQVDLSIGKTNNVDGVAPNQVVTYVIDVRNEGPSAAIGARITDFFPSALTNISYVSSASVGVIGNTPSGNGNIDDSVTLPAAASLTYTATATVLSSAVGSVQNTATIVPPAGSVDLSPGNDTSTDTDLITPVFDLSVTKTDDRSTVVAGRDTTYTVQVRNSGPSDVVGASITDMFPALIESITFTSTSSGGATGNTSNGVGDINDTLNLPAGSTVTYDANGRIASSATGTVSNTATVASSLPDDNPSNDSATDISTIELEADLSISKTDNQESVEQGDPLTYSIVVRNDGPSDVIGASVIDSLPSALVNPTYTSQASGNASGHSSGSGNINDTVNLPSGSSINYTVEATVEENATGTISNTATVNAPSGVTELNLSNNSATDTTAIDVILRSISGFVFVDNNDDGVRDAGEQAILGVDVSLAGRDNLDNTINRDTSTNANGAYRFNDLPPGLYTIEQSQPEPFPNGGESIGTGATIQPAVADNVFIDLGLGRQQDAQNYNFAELRPTRSKREFLASTFG